MKVIGLTGGVGSGKSLVAQVMQAEFGARLLLADELGQAVMKPGTEGFNEIVRHFGERILQPEGTLDRNALADIIFHEEKEREAVNAIIHPLVLAEMKREIERLRNSEAIVVLESAILFESGCSSLCDEVWYVHVPMVLRRMRLSESRGYSPEKTEAIMQKQLSEQEFLARSDKVLENDGTPEMLCAKIRKLLTSEADAAEAD